MADKSAPQTTGGGPLPSLPLLRAVEAVFDRSASARRPAQATRKAADAERQRRAYEQLIPDSQSEYSRGLHRSAPNTALGLGWGALGYGAGKILGTDPKFQFGDNALQVLNSPLQWGGRAVTLGNVQVYGRELHPDTEAPRYDKQGRVRLGDHEEAHTYQAQRLGVDYIPAVVRAARFGRRSPMEREADDFAAETGRRRR